MFDLLWYSVIAFWHSEHFWDGITALSTAAAAVFTAVMARFTFKAIREGQRQRHDTNEHFKKTRQQDEQHHQNGFRPLLTLSPFYGLGVLERENLLKTGHKDNQVFLTISCFLQSIGPGTALNIKLTVRASDQVGNVASRELSPLSASGGSKEDGAIEVPLILTDRFNSIDLKSMPGGLWTIVLEYEDVFGNAFHTLHSKNATLPWCRVGRGPLRNTQRCAKGKRDEVLGASGGSFHLAQGH